VCDLSDSLLQLFEVKERMDGSEMIGYLVGFQNLGFGMSRALES
jgi:hypothetical protein